jgi:hypothetical protein
MMRTSVLVVVVLVAALLGTGPGVATTRVGPHDSRLAAPLQINLGDLPQGAPAKVARLQDGVITTASGRRIRVRVPHAGQHRSCWGDRAGRGWSPVGAATWCGSTGSIRSGRHGRASDGALLGSYAFGGVTSGDGSMFAMRLPLVIGFGVVSATLRQ